MRILSNKNKRQQKGVSLLFVLVLIAIFMILSTIAVKSNLITERASANFRDADLAFQAAESALRAGEAAAINLVGPSDGNATCTNGICFLGNNNWLTNGFSGGQIALNGLTVQQAVFANGNSGLVEAVGINAAVLGNAGVGSSGTGILESGVNPALYSNPKYIIEIIPAARAGEDAQKTMYMYRVTAKGWGVNRNSQAVLQSVYFQPQ